MGRGGGLERVQAIGSQTKASQELTRGTMKKIGMRGAGWKHCGNTRALDLTQGQQIVAKSRDVETSNRA